MSEVRDATERAGPLVLGDVFAPADLLPAGVRVRLAALLAAPGRALAIMPGQLAAMPVPPEPDVRAAVRAAIADGLSSAVLGALSDRALAAVVPALRGEGGVDIGGWVPAPLRAIAEGHAGGISPTGLTIGQITAWPRFGPRRVSALVMAGVDAALEHGLADGPPPPGPSLADLTRVLGHDAATDDELRRLLTRLYGTAQPARRAAAARVLALPSRPHDRCLAFLESALAAAGDARDRAMFEHGVLALGPPLTRADLAAAIGLGPERVRQLILRARQRVDAATGEAPEDVRRLARSLAESIGGAAPRAAVDAALAALALPPLPDTRTRLLVRFAGPYRSVDAHPEWIATDPAELVAETRRMIHEDGGVRLAEHITKELQSLGMAGEYVDAWLACQPVRVVDGLVVALTGTPGDVAERALDVTGQPLSAEEMTAWVPGPPELTAALWRGRDRRFVITVDDELALADWGRDDVATATDGRRPALLRLEVDTAVLAGHDAPIEPGLAHALSLRHGSRRTFPTRYGPVTLTYDDATPRRGSVRAVALAVGAVTGNVLEITLYPDGLGTTVRLLPSPAAS